MDSLLKRTVDELEGILGREVDLSNETYVLQTPDGYIHLGIEEDENGENTIKFHITAGKLTYVETDKDIISHLFTSSEEN